VLYFSAVRKSLRFRAGLPDGAKFGKCCQKSLFSKSFANFFDNIFDAKILPLSKHQLWLLVLTKFFKLMPKLYEVQHR